MTYFFVQAAELERVQRYYMPTEELVIIDKDSYYINDSQY